MLRTCLNKGRVVGAVLLLAAAVAGGHAALNGSVRVGWATHAPGSRGVAGQAARSECDPQPIVPLGENFFTDISAASGIQDENFATKEPIPPANDHTRVAFVDLDGDGWDDVVMHSQRMLPDWPFEHLVFRNNRDGTFTNISDASGLRHVQAAFFAFADVDNDGDQDCFAGLDADITGSLGLTHHLLLNDGQGHFTPRTDSGVEGQPGTPHATGVAVFGDYDGDGNLDLFLGNGAAWVALPDQLFLGNGDGTFREVSERLADRERLSRYSHGAVACDYDNDADLDIFVSTYAVTHHFGHNILWENNGRGWFVDKAFERGFAAQGTGNYLLRSTGYGRDLQPDPPERWFGDNGFGLQCEDVNNDGYLDIWKANISHPETTERSRMWSDPSLLLLNEGPTAGYHFRNVYLDRGLPFSEGDLNAGMADFDNDGRMDLSMSRESKYDERYRELERKGWFGLFHQLADGSFASVGLMSGINHPEDPGPVQHQRVKASASHVWSDIDHDGDLDLLIGAMQREPGFGRPNYLFRNEIGSQNAWLAIRLERAHGNFNRDAIGTRVTLVYPDRLLMRELKANHGIDNSDDTRVLHFGLGDLGCASRVEVRWPNGQVFVLPGSQLGQNRYVTLRYGQGSARPTPGPTPTAVVWPTDTPPVIHAQLYLPRLDERP